MIITPHLSEFKSFFKNASKEDLDNLEKFAKLDDKENLDFRKVNNKIDAIHTIQKDLNMYIACKKMEATKLQRLDQIRIPDNFNYGEVQSLSTEARQKLSRIRPKSIGEAQRIPGVSPNDVSVLLVLMGR